MFPRAPRPADYQAGEWIPAYVEKRAMLKHYLDMGPGFQPDHGGRPGADDVVIYFRDFLCVRPSIVAPSQHPRTTVPPSYHLCTSFVPPATRAGGLSNHSPLFPFSHFSLTHTHPLLARACFEVSLHA